MRDPADIATRDIETGAFLIGYARVSTRDQNLCNQEAQLRAAGCGNVFAEKITGTRRARPQLDRMLDHLRTGDVIVVTRLDRLARSIRDLLDIVERIRDAGAGLRSLAEPWADTTTPAGRTVLTVFGGMAEFERSLIVERTSSGRAAARARGTKFGRKPTLTPAQLEDVYRLADEGNTSMQEIAALFGIHRSTLFRLLSQRAERTG
ncbi:DNA invertase Pin-like site-specific DNA recombinase [Paraburkholderia terricola]|uniref:recombinase family protein n=1 Tax=Paraburkholderia terricola TaxID=169427 RepID=UPI0028660377|nr:recombinase family protein [Paraburkholderia terricola]MDR6495167.1 DNA invertase Pin-like site-specific DNA recombinase [Paraburkholderia terricola]